MFRDIAGRATSLLRWDIACVTALSHVCFVTPSHGFGQQSWHAQSCHLADLHHPHPATCKGGTFRDRCHSRSWLGSAGFTPDQTRHLGAVQLQGCRSTGCYRQCSGRYQARHWQQQSGHPSIWSLVGLEPCPAPQYPGQPYPGSANPRAEPILMGAQEERAVLGLRHIAGTCHPLPPRLWGDREEVLLVGH